MQCMTRDCHREQTAEFTHDLRMKCSTWDCRRLRMQCSMGDCQQNKLQSSTTLCECNAALEATSIGTASFIATICECNAALGLPAGATCKVQATTCECNAVLGTASKDKLQSSLQLFVSAVQPRDCQLGQTAKFKQQIANAMQCLELPAKTSCKAHCNYLRMQCSTRDCQQGQTAKFKQLFANAVPH